jgi:hypothetical protein
MWSSFLLDTWAKGCSIAWGKGTWAVMQVESERKELQWSGLSGSSTVCRWKYFPCSGDHQASSGQQKLHLTYPMGESHPDRNVNPWFCFCDRLMKAYRTCLLHQAARSHTVIILSEFFQTQANTTRYLRLAPPITTSVVSAVGPWIGPQHIMKRAWLLSWKAIVVIGNEITLYTCLFLPALTLLIVTWRKNVALCDIWLSRPVI